MKAALENMQTRLVDMMEIRRNCTNADQKINLDEQIESLEKQILTLDNTTGNTL